MLQPKTPAQARAFASLRIAGRDLETAETLARHSPHVYESIDFSCQPGTKKWLKAGLLLHSLPAPFIDDLTGPATGLTARMASDREDVLAATIPNAFAAKWRYETDDAPDFAVAELLVMAYRSQHKLRPLAAAFIL